MIHCSVPQTIPRSQSTHLGGLRVALLLWVCCDLTVHDGLNALPHALCIPGVLKVAIDLSIIVLCHSDYTRQAAQEPGHIT